MTVTNVTFYPNLLYRDPEAAIAWLEALGFERREMHRDDDGTIRHAELSLGSAIVMLATAESGREPFRSLSPGGSLVYCATGDVEGVFGRAREAGAEITLELAETDYGSLDFTVRDPEGNLWAFGTYRPEVGAA
jgi:uncharacterized glyoxalase superfamily protein PhnB